MKQKLTTLAFLALALSVQAQSDSTSGKAPTSITVEAEINAPIAQVWAEFSNLGGIYLNSPTVASSFNSSEIKTGLGATRHMILSPMMKKGATLDERVTVWEEGAYMKLEVYEIFNVPGIQTMIGDFQLIEKGEKTILRSTLNYSMTSKSWGMMNKMAGKKKFTKVWRKVIAGYRHHIETGEEVTNKTKLDSKSVELIEVKISKTK